MDFLVHILLADLRLINSLRLNEIGHFCGTLESLIRLIVLI